MILILVYFLYLTDENVGVGVETLVPPLVWLCLVLYIIDAVPVFLYVLIVQTFIIGPMLYEITDLDSLIYGERFSTIIWYLNGVDSGLRFLDCLKGNSADFT